ncbi:hypothetical protein [Pedobacter caeni]|uniref:Uncharacterized protein n=1 Tax=Pedobacter caeni TaxID=288992 RepID=A0A1M5A0C4_9SPHI|nr:hypothetical protein [Pedobacter caeni]SHF23346.1 hypothetical protein SAMN04488522_102524 [Pedobacter caeni]
MNNRIYTSIILVLVSLSAFGQRKSVRELLAVSDIVAVTEHFPDPFYPNEKKIAFSNHQAMTVVDSVKVIAYLKKGKKGLEGRRTFINNQSRNSFYDILRVPTIMIPVYASDEKPPIHKTLLFARTWNDHVEVLFFVDLNENIIPEMKKFIDWDGGIQKLNNKSEECRLYIEKYLSMLESNEVGPYFPYFENILLPQSNFMRYYKAKAPAATIMTKAQKERLKNFVFGDDYFGNIENTKLVYEYYPEETLEFYKDKFSNIYGYGDDFDKNADQYIVYLKFILASTNKLDKEAETLFDIFDDNKEANIKETIFERLKEKMDK